MKKIILVIAILLVVSCKNEVTEYTSIKGKLKATGVEKLIVQGRNFSKEILVNEDGSFSDTLKVTAGVYAIANGNDRITIFLKNGFDLKLDFKGEKMADGISFEGNGAETNNFMDNKRSFYLSEFANPKSYFKLDKEAFENKMLEAKNLLKGYKEEAKDLDSLIIQMDTRNDEMFFGYIESNYEKMHKDIIRFAKGNASPTFNDYENAAGGKTSLTDLKGSYVYIDVWATWCAPCKAEIPYLKSLENEYHGKNIKFVSISVDKPGAHDAWEKMVKEKELSGIQLFADNNFESEFILNYGITAIPRFILLDPEGIIINPDAPRPSSPKLKKLFNSLNI